MKLIFRFFVLTALAAAFSAAAFAQDPCADTAARDAAYGKFGSDYYPKTALVDLKAAVAFAKDFVQKYGNCSDDTSKGYVTYFSTSYIPPTEAKIRTIEDQNAHDALYNPFFAGVKAKNWDAVYASGKNILAQEKDSSTLLDVNILLGSIGFDEAQKNNDKYNADTIKYAQDAIKMIESGVTSKNFGYGITFKERNNALAWLNYQIAYLKNDRQKDTKGAIPYYYKVTQYTSSSPSKNPVIYYNIAVNYDDALTKNETDRQDKIKAAGNKDTDETKALFAMSKGYADRVLDAYARAYSLSIDPKDKAGRDTIYAHMKEIYAFRYQKGSANPYSSLDALILADKSKPFVDPSTPVTPVIEAEPVPAATPATGTTGATGTSATTTSATTAPKPAVTAPKPAAATPAKTTPTKTTPKKPANKR